MARPHEQGDSPAPAQDRVEMPERRSQRSRTFVTPSGTFVAELFPGSIHYQDERGAWVPIDATLVDEGDGVLGQHANRIDLDLPRDLTEPVRLADGEESIGFALAGARAGARAASGIAARYADVLDGVDVLYEAHPDGVKESVILENASSTTSVSFDVTLSSGLRLVVTADGGAAAAREDGSAAFVVDAPFAEDANGIAGPATMTIEGSRLTLAADPVWLAAPERAWPVVLDPTVTVGDDEGEVTDCHIASDGDSCTNTKLYVGHGSVSSGHGRALIRFDDLTDVVPRDAIVGDADVDLYLESTQETTPTLDVSLYGLTAAFDTTADWTNRTSTQTWSTAGGDFDSAASWTVEDIVTVGRYHWYPGRLVQSWVNGTRDNHGLLLKTPEDATVQVLRFTSENSATTHRWPRLTVVYGFEWGSKAWHTSFDQGLDDRSELSVNVANGNLHVSATDMSIAGLGVDATVARSYNSRWPHTGMLGSRWKFHNGSDVNLWVYPTGPGLNGPNGHTLKFVPTSTPGEFESPPGANATLEETAPGDYTLTYHVSGRELDFETPSVGCGTVAVEDGRCAVLIAERDRDDNEITYTYSSSTLGTYGAPYLDYITDTRGREIDFVNSTYMTDAIDDTSRDVEWFYVNGDLTWARNAMNRDTTYTYDGNGYLSNIRTPQNRQTGFTYDGDGRVLTVKRITDNGAGTGPTWTFAYGAWTCASQECTAENTITDPNGGVTTYTVAATGEVLSVEDPLGETQETSYTPNLDVATYTDALSAVSTLTYNSDNRPTSATAHPSTGGQTAAATLWSYGDQTNNKYLATSEVDPEGNCTRTEYDTEGHVTDVHPGLTPSGSPLNCDSGTATDRWEYTYNTDGQVLTATDPENNVTTYTYDTDATDLGELTLIEHPDDPGTAGVELGDEAFTYDLLSRVATYTDGKGQVTGYTYDDNDRITRVTFNGDTTCSSRSTCIDHVYDYDGNLTSRIDATGTTTFAYDKQNRVTSKNLPSGVNACTTGGTAMTYEYDPVGNLETHCDGAGVVTYGYDAANRNCWLYIGTPGGSPTCTSPPTGAVTFAHDDAGRRTETVFPTTTAVTQSMDYDDAGNLLEVRAQRADTPTPTELTDFDYTYVDSGAATTDRVLRRTMTDTAGVTTTYTYDSLGQLTGADVAGGTSLDQTYTYDDNGNRTSKTIGGTTTNYTYNDVNQLDSATGQTATPTYDDNGNETTGPDGRTATYTAMDQTASLTPSGSSAVNMSYADASSTERREVGTRDHADTILGLAQDANSGDPTIHYIRDNLGNLVARVTSTTTHYYLVDGLGSIAKLIDDDGAVTNEYRYDPWGNTTVVTAGVYNPWRYAGGHHDTSTGLTKFGARYYDPSIGRWTQRDPSGLDRHYAYASNNPSTFVDPTGLILGYSWDDFTEDVSGVAEEALNVFGVLAFTALGCAAGIAGPGEVGAAIYAVNPAIGTAVVIASCIGGAAGGAYVGYQTVYG